MSNPGVVYLSTKRLSNGVQFRAEDNIGEAIHLHYGDEWRIDLTVQEFLSLKRIMQDNLNNLLCDTGFDIKYFDPIFLDMFSQDLIKLNKMTFESIRLSDLKVQTINCLGLPVIRSLKKSRVYKALSGKTKELNAYKQENHRGQSNLDRVLAMKAYLDKVQYPFNNKYIVLFNTQNIIRDGQHRAACMYYSSGDQMVQVIRLTFENCFNNVSLHPWVEFLFKWNRKRVKKMIKTIYIKGKAFTHMVLRIITKRGKRK